MEDLGTAREPEASPVERAEVRDPAEASDEPNGLPAQEHDPTPATILDLVVREEGATAQAAEAVTDERGAPEPAGSAHSAAEAAPRPAVVPVTEGPARPDQPQAALLAPTAPHEPSVRRPPASWLAALPYAMLWIAFGATSAYLLLQTPDGTALVDAPVYGHLLAGGLVLIAAGVALGLAQWLAVRRLVPREARRGLLPGALLRAGIVTVAGSGAWWAVLLSVDRLRTTP